MASIREMASEQFEELQSELSDREDEKPAPEKETVFVVAHIHQGILYDLAVYQNENDAVKDYEGRIIDCYGSLECDQSGDDVIDWQACEVIGGV